MFFQIGLALLIFLPVIESFDRQIGFNLLLIGAILISFSTFWNKKLRFEKIEWLWVLLLIVFSISTIFSWSLSRSFTELLRYFAYFLVFVSVRRFPNQIFYVKRFFIPMILVNSMILVILAIVYSIPQLHLSPPSNGMNLFTNSFGHNRLSDLLIFALPLAILFFQSSKTKKLKFVTAIGVFVLFIALVSTMARGVFIALAFAFFIFLFTGKNTRNWYIWTVILSLVTIVFLTTSFIFSNFIVSPEKGKQLPKFIYKNAQTESRLEYLRQNLNSFRETPLLGTGLDTFIYVSRIKAATPSAVSWYTHNHYLQILSETGIFGGLIFICLVLSILFRSFRNYQLPSLVGGRATANYQLYNGIFISVIASSIHSLIDYDWQYLSIFMIFWISLGILLPLESSDKNNYDNKTFFPRTLHLLFMVFFGISIFFILSSDKLMASADKLISEKRFSEAKTILEKASRLDTKNSEIVWRLANIAFEYKKYQKAHMLNEKAILLYPFNSKDVIKNDLSLYLVQAKESLNNKKYQEGYDYLLNSVKLYPFYYQFIGGDYYLHNAQQFMKAKKNEKASEILKEYIKTMEKKKNNKKLSDEEITYISSNLK